MSFRFFISLRYLKAKRKQIFVSVISLISILGILLGVAALIIVLAVMNGFESDMKEKILGFNAHIIVLSLEGPMENYELLAQKIEKMPGVTMCSPFIYTQAIIRRNDGISGLVVRGVDPPSAHRVMKLGKFISGDMKYLVEWRKTGFNLPPIVIGKELAKHIGVGQFEEVALVSPFGETTPMGMVPTLKKFIVAGIFDSGFYEYDSSVAYVPLHEAQAFLHLGKKVTGLEVRVSDIYRADKMAREIENRLGLPYWARHWMEMNKNLFSALKMEKIAMFIILSLIVLVAAFNIITALIMIVMEKTRDIAILKSMGATSKDIMKIFIYQGTIIGILGTTLGVIVGLLVAHNVTSIARFLERFLGIQIFPGDVYYLTELPSRVNYGDVAMIVAGSIFLCLIATIYPSRRAAKIDPAEALRYE
ncbi:MAG: lipoprotein-releasing ABC transporter permease subunit [Syntrophales bacterium]|nr:lipoprotein-releasing ABC transporter permease subunit [Syntrophales bacterium]